MSSYTINKTDGSILTDNIADGTVDTTATDLTLIGKNAVGYGEAINENFIKLLENFANSSFPPNAIVGQLWYDTSDNRLKVNTGTGFKVTGGTILSATAPTNAIAGDIWISTVDHQLRFYVDDSTYVLAGPAYTSAQGVSGIQVTTVFDTAEKEHTIGLLYIADSLIGIFSKDAFTPSPAVAGHTGDIVKGFNLGNAAGLSFNVPVTSASQLVDEESIAYTPSSFVKTSGSSVIGYDAGNEATLSIKSSSPLVLGDTENWSVTSTLDTFRIRGDGVTASNLVQNLSLEVDTLSGFKGIKIFNTGFKRIGIASVLGDGTNLTLTFGSLGNPETEIIPPFQVGDQIDIYEYTIPGSTISRSLLIENAVITGITTTSVTVADSYVGSFDGEVRKDPANPRIGILTEEPTVELDVNGRGLFRSDLRVNGNTTVVGDLTILGSTTSITTSDTTIKDNTITLNSGQTGSGISAGSAGIEIDRGSSNKANWKFTESSLSWTSNYYVDLVAIGGLLNLNYKIEGVSVLSATTLGTGVVNSSLTSVGTLVELQVDNININGDVVTSDTGEIDVDSTRISNVPNTVYDINSPPQLDDAAQAGDAVNNLTMQNYTAGLPLQFALELTNATGGDLDDADVITLLTDTFPVDDHVIGTKIYVQCTKTTMDFDGITVTPLVARTLRVYQLITGTPNNWYWNASFNQSYGF